MRLADVHGIGTAMVERLVEAMGDERTVLNALESGDVAGLAAVEGISAAARSSSSVPWKVHCVRVPMRRCAPA